MAALRNAMLARGLDAYLVPREDAWAGEYVAPRDARLAWLTGFTGSAGFAVVLANKAGVFIDGRYRVQVRDQVADVFTPVHWPEVQLGDWLIEHLDKGAVVGFDPWLHSADAIDKLSKQLDPVGIELGAVDNLIDPLWQDQPDAPNEPFFAYRDDLAGETNSDKRARLAAGLVGRSAILTSPDSIAWLLNIRGRDIERNPVPQAFAVLHDSGAVDLFAGAEKANGLRAHLGAEVVVHPIETFLDAIAKLGGPVEIHGARVPQIVKDRLDAAGIAVVDAADPCALPKARKNSTEIAGSVAAHLRDGAAVVRFLAWLDKTALGGGLTEIDVVTALEGFRRETNALLDVSFETICGAGEHGAIVHYRVTEETNRAVNAGELLLVDSGGQYLDGTTDITRTVVIGEPPQDAIPSYTAVLRGMIAISRARFPKGVAGRDLDALARVPLWEMGRDYDHGTGHGVGAYLSVHEGPQGISRRNMVPLEAGMILSNEPGYYREGSFGIRIENLIYVRDAPEIEGADAREMLSFETLTWVPFDRRLIDVSLLNIAEKEWIDRYHAQVLEKIGPRVEGAALVWLEAACAAL